MKPCKDCGRVTMPNCSQCVDCHVKRLWGVDYWEMVGQHIAAVDALPFDGDVSDDDYVNEDMYLASERAEQMAQAG